MKKEFSYFILLALPFGTAVMTAVGDKIRSAGFGAAFGIYIGWFVTSFAIEIKSRKEKKRGA